MRSPNEYFRRLAQRAMELHRLNETALAQKIGCGLKAINHILSEEDVRLTQTQWFNLMALGGAFRNARPNV